MVGKSHLAKTFIARKCTLKPTHPPLACLPKQGVEVAYFEQIVANLMMKTFCLPFGYRTNEIPVSSSTPGKSLISTGFVCPNFPLHLMQKMGHQTTIHPAPWKVDGCKNHLPIWALREHIVKHCVPIITTIH